MEHRDALMSEVTVNYDETPENPASAIIAKLVALGLMITDEDPTDGSLEGTVAANKLPEIHATPGVTYVRITSEWIADYPKGDPRDLDNE
jgi:hypothetical protein